MPNATIQNSPVNKEDVLKKLFNADGTLSYDAVITFLEDLENGTFDNDYSQEDWYTITHFLAFLSEQGIMPNATEDEKEELKKDIQELLAPYKDAYVIKNSSYKMNGYQILPCILYSQGDVVLCKSWVSKQCHHIAKFFKKHKTAIIVGAVLVVAAVAVVATVAIASTTAATAAATAAAESCKHTQEERASNESAKQPEPSNKISDSNLEQSLDSQISDYKNVMLDNNLVISKPEDQGNDRIIGSTLAHEALNDIPYDVKRQNEDLILQGHGKIDNAFSTDQTSFYMNKNGLQTNNLQENLFYLQGQEALKAQNYDQAIDNFGKALIANPNNPNLYLDRAFAYLKSGEFDHSLNDYSVYQEQKYIQPQKSINFGDCVDFSIGASSGLTKGTIESGKQLLSFAGNAIIHPIDTGYEIYEAFSNLAKLVYSQEWKVLKETLAPEVSELINKWETLSYKEKGEGSGYVIGKYGADILLPGAAGKAISQGAKGAKELATIANSLQNAEKVVVLEAFAGSAGESSMFSDTLYNLKNAEKAVPYSSEFLNSIKGASSISTKNDILNIIKPNGQWIGTRGYNDFIRLLKGGQKEGKEVFNELTKQGKIIYKDSEKIVSQLSDEIYITYRPISTSGPATIDINIESFERNIKIKFLEEK